MGHIAEVLAGGLAKSTFLTGLRRNPDCKLRKGSNKGLRAPYRANQCRHDPYSAHAVARWPSGGQRAR